MVKARDNSKVGKKDLTFLATNLLSTIYLRRRANIFLPAIVHEYIDHALSHDEIHASSQILREYKWNQNPQGVRWRQPLVFGPLPGPRQDAHGDSHTESLKRSSTTKAIVKFKTSATILQNLFPNSKYFFEKPDTVAVASYSIETLENMQWLGGGEYNLLALYVHGVCYKEDDGRVRKGVYCPIMLENLTDPILTGREELGVPKMFSDIDITRSDEGSFVAKVSWRGAIWGEFEWKNLQGKEVEGGTVSIGKEGGESESEGLLLHKYIPGTGSSTPDADYDVLLVNFQDKSSRAKSSQSASPADVRFEIKELGWKDLPTLHPIVSRLAELPVFEVLEGTVTKKQGVPDLREIVRLN